MESPSGPAHRGLVPMQGLLLAASLLIFWSLPTTAQLTIESVPPNAAEGKDVLLRVHNLPGNLFGYTWYKGEIVDSSCQIISYVIDTQTTTLGPASSGRETIYPNGSLLFQKVTLKDTGYYSLQAGECGPYTDQTFPFPLITSCVALFSAPDGPDAPTISPSDSHYLRGTNLNLSCQAASNPPAQYSWLINGSSQHPTQELFIPKITAHDSGSYTCLAHNSVTGLNRTTVMTITVYGPGGKPSIRASNATVTEHKDAVVLTCLTNDRGISIRWLFENQNLLLTDRMKLSQGNSTLTIDPVRREDAGDYQCEVFNPVSSGKSEPLRLDVQSEQKDTGYSVGTIIGSVIGVLIVVALGASLGYFLYLRRTRRYHGISFTLTLILSPDPGYPQRSPGQEEKTPSSEVSGQLPVASQLPRGGS
ncbi:Carcinoembryonic antigen-related cell adhesion molecule 1 [Myotis davidii]|uniref:Carcinoembryonic antigen-related cell adhesion molecule 1 n=1 Tax=Myotis davidii TaxID=225400 RepID=L5LD80_MYODS|nr:Carcinoembryonic antigen-related cell adhesion molecule 1 [Myotis davidii]